MLPKFSNEVLSRGSSAVLPHNLNDFWLKAIQKRCDDFLDSNFSVDQCVATEDIGDPVLVACVHEILRHNHGISSELSLDELAEKVTIYALSVTMETIRREADIKMALPTMEDLLSIDRIVQFGKVNPHFGQFLKQACVVHDNPPQSEPSWFGRIKAKILAHIKAD